MVLRVGFLMLEPFFSHLWIFPQPFPTADHSVKLRRRCYEDEVRIGHGYSIGQLIVALQELICSFFALYAELMVLA